MNLGQIVIGVAVLAFFGYEVYALFRDIKKKQEAKKNLEEEGQRHETAKKIKRL